MSKVKLSETLKYIEQREKTLENYSEKLQNSLVAIARMFGWRDDVCRFCGYLKTSHGSINHEFMPQIAVAIDVRDTEPFLERERDDGLVEEYYLAIEDKELFIYMTDGYSERLMFFDEAERWVLKALVKSGRLAKFFKYVADVLEKKNKEYAEVANIAEKLAAAVRDGR
jgi:hypothetical protein